MTALGKTLVIVNLVFSVFVGAFVVVVYMAQAHWAAVNKELDDQNKVLKASVSAYQTEVTKNDDYARADAELGKAAGFKADDAAADKLRLVKDALKAARDDADKTRADLKRATEDLAQEKQKTQQVEAVVKTDEGELKKHQDEAEISRKRLQEQATQIAGLLDEKNKYRDQAVAATLAQKSLQDRNMQLEKEKTDLARDLQRMVANGGGTLTAGTKPRDVNPPAEDVEGLIREVSPGGLVRLTIGSDAGLAKNQTLEVYRLNDKAPEQSRYLGRIKIVEVSASEAVAQPVGKPTAPFQVGDQVGSRILGS
jgi:DNA repair exonuclease SbcCD ATPase subunit